LAGHIVLVSPKQLGLSSSALSFLGTPTTIDLPSAATTVDYTLASSSGVAIVNGFTFSQDQLDVDLNGALTSDLVAFDTTYNGQHAIALADKYSLGQGVVITGVDASQTAADLLANHTVFSDGHALIS